MNQVESTIFCSVLDHLTSQYKLEVGGCDGILKLKNHYGRMLGEFNTEGYCLLYNLTRLCKLLEDELR